MMLLVWMFSRLTLTQYNLIGVLFLERTTSLAPSFTQLPPIPHIEFYPHLPLYTHISVVFSPQQQNFSFQQTEMTTENHNQIKYRAVEPRSKGEVYKILCHLRLREH